MKGTQRGFALKTKSIETDCFFFLEKLKMPKSEFYLRYYVGHKGKFGHEFLEFEFRPDGKIL